jgi:hypothetical protein
MKIRTTKETGAILVTALVVSAIMGVALASYLGIVRSQHRAVARSVAWNTALPVAEAGVEEALAHLNFESNRVISGWVLVGTNYVKSRTNTVAGTRYEVSISTNALRPIIVSKAYVTAPMSTNVIKRGVRVACTNRNTAIKGMLAKGKMMFSGDVIADSFDSTDATASTGGAYDPAKKKANGYIGTNGKAAKIIEASGSVQLYGSAATGPTGTIVAGGGAKIGDTAWQAGGTPGIQPGHSADDMNVYFPDVQVPFTGGFSVPTVLAGILASIGGTNYTYALGNGTYQMATLVMASSQKMMVNGNAILYVTGNVDLSGQSYIYIAPGASLNIYVGGATTSIGGNGVANPSGQAKSFQYFGLPNNTTINFSGNGTFAGVIYAPQANFTMSGGGSGPMNFVGASTTSTVTMSGSFNFHYDESLANSTDALYVASSWDEIAPTFN